MYPQNNVLLKLLELRRKIHFTSLSFQSNQSKKNNFSLPTFIDHVLTNIYFCVFKNTTYFEKRPQNEAWLPQQALPTPLTIEAE